MEVLKYLFDYLLVLCMYMRVCMHVSVLRFSSRMYCIIAKRTYVRTCTPEKGVWQDLCHSIRMRCMCCISRMRAVYIQYVCTRYSMVLYWLMHQSKTQCMQCIVTVHQSFRYHSHSSTWYIHSSIFQEDTLYC